MLIDSHAHLESEGVDTFQVINNMEKDGLDKIITIGTHIEDCVSGVNLANKHNNIYCTVGLHPEYADDINDDDLKIIDELATNDKVVAIGEIGLDYHYTQNNKEKQKDLFVKQIKIAKKHNIPLCIHSRDAKEDMYNILSEYKDDIVFPSVMHCFSEDKEFALKFIELGFYLSFAGNITFKKTDRSFLKDIPLNKILVETDSPYLSPEPLRGKLNQPCNVKLTAQKIADELEMDYEEFKKIILNNTYNVFKKMKRD